MLKFYWLNNWKLDTCNNAWSDIIIAMLFKFLSSSNYPHPNRSLVERECHIKWWMSWSPASDKDAVKVRMIGKTKVSKLDLKWMESAVIKSAGAVNGYDSYIPL